MQIEVLQEKGRSVARREGETSDVRPGADMSGVPCFFSPQSVPSDEPDKGSIWQEAEQPPDPTSTRTTGGSTWIDTTSANAGAIPTFAGAGSISTLPSGTTGVTRGSGPAEPERQWTETTATC